MKAGDTVPGTQAVFKVPVSRAVLATRKQTNTGLAVLPRKEPLSSTADCQQRTEIMLTKVEKEVAHIGEKTVGKCAPVGVDSKPRLFSINPLKKAGDSVSSTSSLKRFLSDSSNPEQEKRPKISTLPKVDMSVPRKSLSSHCAAPDPFCPVSEETVANMAKEIEVLMRLDTDKAAVNDFRRTVAELHHTRMEEELELIDTVNTALRLSRDVDIRLAKETLSLLRTSTDASEWFLQLTLANIEDFSSVNES